MWKRADDAGTARIVADGLPDALEAALAARERRAIGDGHGAKSAVLMPLFEQDGDVHVVLLRRAENLRRHGGQVAFPGGRHDPTDTSLSDTALREAEEEIGLMRVDVRMLGALDDLSTFTGYVVTPYAAWLAAPHIARPNPSEVARVFTAPLATFLTKPRGLFPRVGWHVDGEFVWGATRAILTSLLAVVQTTPAFRK
jgi:8-oxo-dGTP pyrophosphatase MutT (NUDIX family)